MKSQRRKSFYVDKMGLTVFVWNEEGLTISVPFYNNLRQIFATLWLRLLCPQHNWTLKSKSWINVHCDCWQHSTSGLKLIWTHCFFLLKRIFLKGLMPKHLRMAPMAKSFSKPLPQWTIEHILPANQLSDFHPNISATFDWTLVA